MTPAQRSLYGRIGAAVARSRHDPRDLTAAGRTAFLARFEARVRAEYPGLPEPEVERRASELRKAHMLALAAKSSIARSKEKASGRVEPDALEVGHGSDRTTTARS